MLFYFFFSVFFCFLSYINMDPMKSSFFLVLSLLLSMPLISFYFYIWFSYFICLLFLSGVFVILVYFSSLSSVSNTKMPLSIFCFFLSFFSFFPFYFFYYTNLSINNFYFNVYWLIIFFIITVLLVFMNFTSYYLNFSGALRKY
uniref:NADH dehydrogenase subunit 6 n=2 Tax=Steinernema TaxID=34507 RepID=A0A1E1G7C1_STECR|nr:NADH dehydrogenase subunit 6 [Steinernema abbasi]AYV63101.1 NADH dehydrogenase subunit 6 [Steinernema abbasi]QAA11077.1 NADH dehydrogenase subunit 6 [Steinernema carpocapsae]BAV78650.1 NADH dehydrogenase subunit 6 [Steinernema carpocapsae]